jgi:hypothetical protein
VNQKSVAGESYGRQRSRATVDAEVSTGVGAAGRDATYTSMRSHMGTLIRSFVIAVLSAVSTASIAQQAPPLGVSDIPQMIATHEANVARFQTTYRSRQFEGVGRVEAISPTANSDLFAETTL